MYHKIAALALMMTLCSSGIMANGKKITKIVLDAGHGGKDIGARGTVLSRERHNTGSDTKAG